MLISEVESSMVCEEPNNSTFSLLRPNILGTSVSIQTAKNELTVSTQTVHKSTTDCGTQCNMLLRSKSSHTISLQTYSCDVKHVGVQVGTDSLVLPENSLYEVG